MVELNIKEEEPMSPEFREPIYIDLTNEDDDKRDSEKRQLIEDALDSESELDEPPSTESSSENESVDSAMNYKGIETIVYHDILMNGRQCIVACGKSCQNGSGSLDRLQRMSRTSAGHWR